MSGQSQQAKAAGSQAQWQAQLAELYSGVARPELQSLTASLSKILGSANSSGKLGPDLANQLAAQMQLKSSYDQAGRGSKEAIQYGGLRSGEGRLSPGAVGSAITSSAIGLDRDRASAMRNLDFMSAQASMADYNQVLQLLGQATKTGTALAGGFGGIAGQAIGGMNSQAGGFLPGFATGSSIGGIAGPYGAAIGGIAGGLIGAGSGT